MGSRVISIACERTRRYVSLALDSELSEFEDLLLDAHLGRCPACRTFANDVIAQCGELRRVALEPVPQPVAVPGERRSRPSLAQMFRPLQAAAAAAVIAAAAGLGSVLALDSDSDPQAELAERARQAVAQPWDVQRDLHVIPGLQPGEEPLSPAHYGSLLEI